MIGSLVDHYLAVSLLQSEMRAGGIKDEVQPEQVKLETDFAKALIKPLTEFYKAPFTSGFAGVPTKSEAAIQDWLTKQYRTHDEWSSDLESALLDYSTSGVELGISQGIELLSGPKVDVKLENKDVILGISDRIDELLAVGTEQSLIDTTINDLSSSLFKDIVAGVALSVAAVLLLDRIKGRSVLISDYEMNRTVNVGLVETYTRNGVVQMEYITRQDDDVCKRCAPDNEKKFLIPPSILLPRHPHCRCIYVPVIDNWNPPIEWWSGKA